MSAKSRRKGASFERTVAKDLFLLTGVTFKRNLEQSREAAHGDLVADDPDWPFSTELKVRAAGISCASAWKAQAAKAAEAAGKIPAVVFKYDRQPVRVAVPLAAITGSRCGDPAEWAEITLEGFAYVAREIMAAQVVRAAE